MTHQNGLFDSIETAQEYLTLLSDTVCENRAAVECDIAADSQPTRRTVALRLVSYNLAKLELHLRTGRAILDDLLGLRRVLLQEKEPATVPAPAASHGSSPAVLNKAA
jgi:hypothetical protein